MSQDFVTIEPEERRPYIWARNEMRRFFPNPDYFRLTNLDERVDKPLTHFSLFPGGPGEHSILRVFWLDTNSVKYSIITNYAQLKREHPELVALYERNGRYAYEQELEMARRQGRNTKEFFVDLG